MNVVGIGFSYADNSLQTRGLKLLNDKQLFTDMYEMLDFNMPVCNSNKSDGQVPDSVNKFCEFIHSFSDFNLSSIV